MTPRRWRSEQFIVRIFPGASPQAGMSDAVGVGASPSGSYE
jgi:hypothetical protein